MSISARRFGRSRAEVSGVSAQVAGAVPLGEAYYSVPGDAIHADFVNGSNGNAGAVASLKKAVITT